MSGGLPLHTNENLIGGGGRPSVLNGESINNNSNLPGVLDIQTQRALKENANPNLPNPSNLLGDTGQYKMLISGNPVSLKRSELITPNDRFTMEQSIMDQLRAGGGPIGTTLIDLRVEKVPLLGLDSTKTLTNKDILVKLRQDGVYVDDPQTQQKFTDVNVQKLEERILKEINASNRLEATLKPQQKTNYFKMNGEIKLHNDLLADEITRPADLAFEQTEAFQVKEQNAILCNRLHSFKKRYYRLDIVLGKIQLKRYPSFFSEEDKMALELKDLYFEFERRTSLAMIPFYMDRVKFIDQQIYLKERDARSTVEEKEFLKQNLDECQRKLDQEKREIEDSAQALYNKWKLIKEERKKNQYASTNVKIKVHKNEDTGEFFFNRIIEEPSKNLYGGAALPGSEISRRNNAKNIRAYVRLIINGNYVARTKKQFLSWPNFEIEIGEMFQVLVFTMPSSIQLEIVIGTFREHLVDVIDVEVPGKYVRALTSAASLVKDISFSKYEYEKKKLAKKYQAQSYKPEGVLSEAQKKKMAEEQKKKDDQDATAVLNDIKGVVFMKAEWKGEGPDMPPMRSENIFKTRIGMKVRKEYSEDEQRRMLLRQLYIDVNDPRNEKIIKFIKETKNEFLVKLLKEDSKNPLSSLKPFRHMLLQARNKDPELAKEIIPLLEREIIENPYLLDKLEVLYREIAYREYLEKKVEVENQQSNRQEKVFMIDYEDNAVKFDAECIRRRQQFFDKLKQYAKEIKAGHQKASTQYKSVVREFELLDAENPLVALFNKMFISGRKLRPIVQKRQPVSLDSCKETKIMVHVIKGFHVPIRSQARKEIMLLQGNGAGKQMDPFNRGAGPTTMSMNNNQFGGGGFGGGFDSNNFGGDQGFRSSMGGMGMGGMGMSNMGRNGNFTGTNRMINGIPLNSNQLGGSRGIVQGGDQRELTRNQFQMLYKTARVETLVEVRIVFNEDYSEVQQTYVAEGDFPEWNEVLNFSLIAMNGKRFTKDELINNKSMIYVTLFDREFIYDTAMNNPSRVVIDTQLKYLGSFSIPLTALLNNPPKMEAQFKINRPLALFNYQVEKNSFFFMNPTDQKDQNLRPQEIPNTYISMSISLDPVLELPQDNEMEYYPGSEATNLLISATEWAKSLRKGKLEKRNIKLVGENIYGQSVLLSRYITEQAPPNDVYDYETSRNDNFAIEKAARYVSLIPFIADNQAFMEMPDLFCNSQEFLDLGAGDFEEHAILLCNYFNFIDSRQNRPNFKSYLLLGNGAPEGRTAYVMRRDTVNNHVELWNPMKGEAYFFGREEVRDQVGCLSISRGYRMDIRLNDPTCQLQSIGCVIGADNVWANINENDDPSLMDYNLSNTKFWKPFFTKANLTKHFPGGQILTIQPPIKYMPPISEDRANVIAHKIQQFISDHFEKERITENQQRTKWNNQMEQDLNDYLTKCEIYKGKSRQGATNSTLRGEGRRNAEEDLGNVINQKIQQEIDKNAKGQKSWGFPINVTFVSLPLLWEEVKNTKLHRIQDDDAEFSLQVYVGPYSHNVLSVWFYLLSLTFSQKRRFQ